MCINKNFDLHAFKEVLKTSRSYNIGIRAYVLLKPPLLTERDALLDALSTIQEAKALGVTTVSLNPVNVQKNTLVERLWFRRKYRPAWLWTLIEILSKTRASVDSSINIVCDPVAAGKVRGVHNCGKCDGSIISAIRNFSLEQNPAIFSHLDCDCKQLWRHTLIHEDFAHLIHRNGT